MLTTFDGITTILSESPATFCGAAPGDIWVFYDEFWPIRRTEVGADIFGRPNEAIGSGHFAEPLWALDFGV
jgi:hypothetical protein